MCLKFTIHTIIQLIGCNAPKPIFTIGRLINAVTRVSINDKQVFDRMSKDTGQITKQRQHSLAYH